MGVGPEGPKVLVRASWCACLRCEGSWQSPRYLGGAPDESLDLYPIGWVHTLASLIALATGAIVLVRPKGTPVHKLRGRIYVLAMIATGLTSFAIYRLDKFWFPHWFAVASLSS